MARRAFEDIRSFEELGISHFDNLPPLHVSYSNAAEVTTLFVGQLGKVDLHAVRVAFEKFGEVEAVIPIPRRLDNVVNPRNLKHSVFVQMRKRSDAVRAMDHLHEQDFGLGPVMVREATSTKKTVEMDPKLFVGMLSLEMTDGELANLFQPFGNVVEAVVMRIRGKSRGCGWVRLDTVDACARAIHSLNGRITLRLPTDELLIHFDSFLG